MQLAASFHTGAGGDERGINSLEAYFLCFRLGRCALGDRVKDSLEPGFASAG
jgi:hypothetical protein